MSALIKAGMRLGALVLAHAAMLAPAGAAGALAIGACGAYGHAYDFKTDAQANAAALAHCKDKQCRVVATVRDGCIAFAIDGGNPCGPHGFATTQKLATAQNSALRSCYSHGGKDCVTRAFVCDGRAR